MQTLRKHFAIIALLAALAARAAAGESDVSVSEYGATGDGVTLDHEAINAAIEAVAKAGGGEVSIPAGDYLCYSIRLRSNVTLNLSPGATIIAADPPAPGEPGGYDPPEPNDWSEYQDFGHSHWRNSLIWGDGLENVAIVGRGMIYGRGLSRGNGRISLPVGAPPPPGKPGDPLPDVLAADGDFEYEERDDLKPGPFGYPNSRDTLPSGVGNKAIALKNCRNVLLRDFTLLHGGHFAILATGVDGLTIDNITIDTNRDGIDIDACQNVRVSNCAVNAPWDDGICLKSSHGLGEARVTENVVIANCFVSGYDEGTLLDGTRQRTMRRRGGAMGRIKFGTEAGGGFRNVTVTNCVFDYSRGLALEQVDGGVLEDIVISNITMRDVPNAPIFIRLGGRLRAPGATEPGYVRRILIDNIVAWNVSPDHGILISGLPGHRIQDVTLSNLQIHYKGGGTAEQAQREIPELRDAYPDPELFGVVPSWGMFARHVENLQLSDIELRVLEADARPAIFLEDARGVDLHDVTLSGPGASENSSELFKIRGSKRIRALNTTGLADGEASPRQP